MTRVPVILNPIAGGGRLLRQIESLRVVAADEGYELDIWKAENQTHTAELARSAAEKGIPLILAYGGDGTYNTVAKGLLGSATAMGTLPGGTTSVLAYELGVPRPARRSVVALVRGEDRPMRVGRTDRGDIVLLMLSAGPDSQVLDRVRPSFKRLGGRIGVAMQALVEAFTGGPLPRIRVVTTGEPAEVGWVIVGNSRSYGSRYHATPGADPFADQFEVVAQSSRGRRAAVSFLFGIPSGRHVKRDDVVREVVEHVRLEPASPNVVVPCQIDGDVAGTLPVEIAVDPLSLLVRLPENAETLER